MRERRLAVTAPGDEAPGNTHHIAKRVGRHGVVVRIRWAQCRHRIRRVVRALEAVCEGRHSGARQRVQLVAPGLLDEVQFLAHPGSPLFTPPVSLRNASMNGSMPPSITFWTSGILSSVR